MREIEPPAEPARAPTAGRRLWASGRRGRGRTWVLGGGGGRGAAQVGALLAMFEYGLEPPDRLIGVSVGALNACTLPLLHQEGHSPGQAPTRYRTAADLLAAGAANNTATS